MFLVVVALIFGTLPTAFAQEDGGSLEAHSAANGLEVTVQKEADLTINGQEYANARTSPVLLSTFTVGGTVVNHDTGSPIAGVTVVLWPDTDGGAMHGRIHTDASGTFLFTDVPPGEYLIEIHHNDYMAWDRFAVTDQNIENFELRAVFWPITISTDNINFGSQPIGYGEMTARSIVVENVSSVNVIIDTGFYIRNDDTPAPNLFEIASSTPALPAEIGPGQEITIQVRPLTGLGAGLRDIDLRVSVVRSDLGTIGYTPVRLRFDVTGGQTSPPISTGRDRDRDRDRNSGNQSTTTSITNAISAIISTANAQSLAQQAIQSAIAGTTPAVRLTNPGNITHVALQAMVNAAGTQTIAVNADSLNAVGEVDVRIRFNPAQATGDLNLAASTTNVSAMTTSNLFQENFGGTMSVISLSQQGSFGMEVRIAAKVDADLDTANLYFYAYDRASNTFRRFVPSVQFVDGNGFLQFTTTLAGDIVVTNTQL
ncbi:MAG: carboxypeptidase-like regulatory domain-containing protein [Oscillospiraceae bacterium]|nr:carboxypeptidase-like regulatory domain-containing protein [Oscillospiraceae bacterium]